MNQEIDYSNIFKKFSKLKSGALFMKLSRMKIRMAFELIKTKLHKVDFVIWIAPANFLATNQYKEDIKYFSGNLYRKICFYAIENISMADDKYLNLYNLADKYRTFCVVDESITIKNTESGRTRRLLFMRHKFKYRLILSGTPLTQGIVDLYSQMQFMDSDILKMTQSQFMNNFLSFYVDEFDFLKRWSDEEKENKLIKMIKPYILHCDLEDKLNIKYFDHKFELTAAEMQDYVSEKEFFFQKQSQVAFLQLVQHFQYLYTLSQNKIHALFKLVNDIVSRKEKVIIYLKFLSEIRFFKESGGFGDKSFVVMTGRSNKIKALNRFERNVDIMLCTYKVESPRINLCRCNNIIFFTQTFDYKDKIQSLNNFYQTENIYDVNIYNFWVETGLEKLIQDSLGRKETVLNHVSSIMSKEEVMNL